MPSILPLLQTVDESSGDFFDALTFPTNGQAYSSAMSWGHGRPAALVAAIVRSVVSELRPLWTSPARFLVAINRAMLGAFKTAISPCLLRHFTVLADLDKGSAALCQRRASQPTHLAQLQTA